MILLKGCTCTQALIFAEGFCWTQGTDVTMKDFGTFLALRRCKNWAQKIFSGKYLSEGLFSVFPQSTECLISPPHPELLSGGVGGQQL